MWPAGPQRGRDARRQFSRLLERQRLEAPERAACVLLRVQRQRRLVPGDAVPVRVVGILFLDAATVGQEQLAQLEGRARGDDGAAIALPHQQRQRAGMVQVRVRQHHRVERARVEGQGLPVHQTKLLVALEQPAIDQHAPPAVLDEVLRAGHRPGRAEEAQFHAKQAYAPCGGAA
jgi:hypothetical protein